MWKILLAFVVFAVGAVFLLMQGGDIDMGGEKHGVDASHTEESSSVPSSAPAASASSH